MSVAAGARDDRDGPGAGRAAEHIAPGEQRVTSDPGLVVSAILGSCVAACLNDPVAQVGGMNHVQLPGGLADRETGARMSVHAMERLIDELLSAGATRPRLQAKVFGGAALDLSLADAGGSTASFARQFLRREGIAVVAECLGGRRVRRVQFWPVSGRVRRSFLSTPDLPAQSPPERPRDPGVAGAPDLF